MIVYAETSAVLAWLFGEANGAPVPAILEEAEVVAASRLTLVECARAFHRVRSLDLLQKAQLRAIEWKLAAAAASWLILELESETLDRACEGFPEEPVRTLDALHLAAAIVLAQATDGAVVLSLDNRVRSNAEAMGFKVLPPAS